MFQVNPLKNQALISSKDKSKKLKCRLLQFLFGALRVINLKTDLMTMEVVFVRVSQNFIKPECSLWNMTV